jgi:predicted metal-dependent phosphoesterase TrpH
MQEKADLHIHTNYSDGALSPACIIRKAHENDLSVISITDHDTVDGIDEAIEEGKKYGIDVIPGVELSSDIADFEVHILGYFMDKDNSELQRYLKFFRDERAKRAERIVKKVNWLGVPLKYEHILEVAGDSAIGRPHIAQAMLAHKLVPSFQDAFNRFLGNYAPAYEKKIHISPGSAFKIITDAGGLAFIAHPNNFPEHIINELIKAGADGIEIIHPSHSADKVRYYKQLAGQYFMLTSGGSDYHGGKKNDDGNFGKFTISPEVVDAMRQRLSKNTA